MSFLDELKQQAQARRAELRGSQAVIEHNVARVEAACATVWRYLDDLGRQLDVLKPVSHVVYAIDPHAVVEQAQFTDFSADIRRQRIDRGPLAAPDWVDHIVLTARLVSGLNFELAKDFPTEIERLEARLVQAGIHCVGEPRRDPNSGHFVENRYAFTADLMAGVRVLPQHEAGRLQFVIQNLDGLSTIKAGFAAAEVTVARLDELARWWVGQPQHFLDGAQDVERIEPW